MSTVLFGESNANAPKNLSLLKLRPGRPTRAVLCISEPVWFRTHYLGRSYFCAGDDCPACEGHASRVQGFLTIIGVQADKPRPVLLEITPAAWSRGELSARIGGHTLEPGREVTLSRAKSRSPLLLETEAATHPIPPALKDRSLAIGAAALIHQIRAPFEDESIEEWASKTKEARTLLLRTLL